MVNLNVEYTHFYQSGQVSVRGQRETGGQSYYDCSFQELASVRGSVDLHRQAEGSSGRSFDHRVEGHQLCHSC